ncbi:bifunctional helix-turn-helix transcriptional regulator/GNAT family N-acetyltransferase [Shewanella sp. D64]|uniref:bifunctional helix-turn-helix transcriptional regulator/GNAT family N-acetyltransferase n=1 Tax=unclassified Shewanella TaxID=196818 RepID=UPI0022BA44D8|nr:MULTISPECIES: bifunctional helix-turn-helix transcriptional regulator/GNAT family N-acetyltransferase [unclassified Shewanella]MEC4728129.1 bifunctional helix-turn-helix transcriptional regulator/GNAT family N-acetyltransferase [Shewanella sp. D64]MEC4740249.1 bifunctional helix-turn-helix transcriptional regulator/GNAT family N-acetyltransferase [Shewanella sp. E94]WBJ98262.1 bifunctional helix-turn-helix transcriptional regulator/GNAT family N-acetyltransferase [Shewanella sp. MTB7]
MEVDEKSESCTRVKARTGLRTVSRHIVRQLGMLNSAFGDLPLSPAQAHTLIELSNEAMSIKQLSQLLNIDKSNASRAVTHLIDKGFAYTQSNPKDTRSLLAHLTPQGKKQLQKLHYQQNTIFDQILCQLSPEEATNIESAMSAYNKAICRTQAQQGYIIREITPADDVAIAQLIREVSAEYGLTADKGYSVADPTLESTSAQYQAMGSRYWVIELDGLILGGAGIAPLSNEQGICELQKMYFNQQIRGMGFAKRMGYLALNYARRQQYQACYLETTACLKEAINLYEAIGFEHVSQHLGNTGHDACELPMLLKLG